jgi:predicted MFS family arabinose efflux permease
MRYPALRARNFALLWSGLIVSNVGTWMQNVAQSWLVYKTTGDDPLYLGWLGLAFALPMVLAPPLGGLVADRVDRVRLLYFTQTSAALLAVTMALLTWGGALRPWHILAATFAGALLLAFDNPARQALVPDLVPREHLQNALSLNSATFTGAALLGPAVAGVLLPRVGAGWLFLLNAASFLAVIGALARMRDLPEYRPSGATRHAPFAFGYLAKEPTVGALLFLGAVAALSARSYPQLLPIFANAWRAGPEGYGTLLSAGGAGAIAGAVGISSAGNLAEKGRVCLASGVCLGIAVACFTLTSSVRMAVPLLAVAGAASTVYTTMIATILQLRAEREFRGRVMSLHVVTLIGLPATGSLLLVALARVLPASWGTAAAVRGGAIVFLFVLLARARVLLRVHGE